MLFLLVAHELAEEASICSARKEASEKVIGPPYIL